MKRIVNCVIALLVVTLFPANSNAGDNNPVNVQSIIDKDIAPEGVVFEIASRDKHYLDWALPEAERLSGQLRARFPELDIVIVSHGAEQFALAKTALNDNVPLNTTVQSLLDNGVQVHVCGTHAERKGVAAEEFSTLVDVAAEGPAQINDYIRLGYVKIRIVK